jgi:glutamyl/glutaminyl-tRNA synthetase
MTTASTASSGAAPGIPTSAAGPVVVTRFAPSPTGYLHVGGARTALFSWLLARHFGGKFLLRIEDTDLARSTEQAASQLLEDLRWLGLHWDNAELVYQSKRLDTYNRVIDDLIARGHAYKAWETDAEIAADRAKQGKQYRYRRPTSPTAEQVRGYEAESRPHVVRFAMAAKPYAFDDVVLGPGQGVGPDEAQDFVIRKSDGMPTFHLAVVVDDAEMGVTHVLRGQEHLLNTCKHIALQEALGYLRPAYGHLPIIQNLDGSKMGKRDRDKKIRQRAQEVMKSTKRSAADVAKAAGLDAARFEAWLGDAQQQLDIPEQAAVMHVIGLRQSDLPEILVHDFRKNGYLPEALLNFLALLGWSPGGDREHLTMAEMTELFTVEGINKGNAKFDRTKLMSFSTTGNAAAAPDRLLAAFRDYLSVNPDSPLGGAADAELTKLLAMKAGFRLLREVDEVSRFFYAPDDQLAFDADAVEKNLKKNDGAGLSALRDVRGVLAAVTSWTAASCEGAVKGYCDQKGLGLGKVAQPIRVAISGTTVSPPIFESLEFLGKERTLARIDRCLAAAGG